MLEIKQLNTKSLLVARLLKITGLALLVIVASAGVVVWLASLWLKPPSSALTDLFWLLFTSGTISVLLALIWFQWSQRGARLLVQLIVTYLVGVVIALINVALTSNMMFLNVHDLKLTSLLIIFSALISIFFAYFLAQRLAQPVMMVRAAARQIANGKFNTRVMLNGSYELVDLGETFNSMAQQLEESAQRQHKLEKMRTELVAAISHDLRTPLASLRLMTEAVSDGVTDEQQTKLFLGRMRTEVEYMTGLIEDLLELSQLDAHALKLKIEQSNLSDLISDTLESLQDQAAQKHQTLTGQVDPHLPELSFDMRKIQRVLNNLISNAIRYTPENGTILITAKQQGQWVEVSVHDNGDGIPPEEKERIFEAFYRTERSRGRESGGTGLGLAIAKGLIEAHGGQIEVQSQPQQGSTFIFRLPLNSAKVS